MSEYDQDGINGCGKIAQNVNPRYVDNELPSLLDL
jgi:hypothetical protein